MYHYKLSPKEIWEMTEEQVDMLVYGLVWMGIVKVKTIVDANKGAWDKLRGLVKK